MSKIWTPESVAWGSMSDTFMTSSPKRLDPKRDSSPMSVRGASSYKKASDKRSVTNGKAAPVPNGKRRTLKQLLSSSPLSWVRNAADVRIIETQQKLVGGHRKLRAATMTAVTSGRRHVSIIESLDGDRVSSGYVKVSCDCEAFMYTFEWALWMWGAADIKYSNGAPASYTNPKCIPGMCKHLVKLSLYAIKKGI